MQCAGTNKIEFYINLHTLWTDKKVILVKIETENSGKIKFFHAHTFSKCF